MPRTVPTQHQALCQARRAAWGTAPLKDPQNQSLFPPNQVKDEAETAAAQANAARADQIAKALTAAYMRYTIHCMDMPFQHAPSCLRLLRQAKATATADAMDTSADDQRRDDKLIHLSLVSQIPVAQ